MCVLGLLPAQACGLVAQRSEVFSRTVSRCVYWLCVCVLSALRVWFGAKISELYTICLKQTWQNDNRTLHYPDLKVVGQEGHRRNSEKRQHEYVVPSIEVCTKLRVQPPVAAEAVCRSVGSLSPSLFLKLLHGCYLMAGGLLSSRCPPTASPLLSDGHHGVCDVDSLIVNLNAGAYCVPSVVVDLVMMLLFGLIPRRCRSAHALVTFIAQRCRPADYALV